MSIKKLLLILLLPFALYSCKDDVVEPIVFSITSNAFESGAPIPPKYTCDSSNISPALSWTNVPDGTESYAIIVEDPDAVQSVGYTWNHCVMFNIRVQHTSLKEGITPNDVGNLGGLMVRNSSNGFYYEGPCPPQGQTHTYRFLIYAIDVPQLEGLNAASKRADLDAAMQGHILGEASLRGTYGR